MPKQVMKKAAADDPTDQQPNPETRSVITTNSLKDTHLPISLILPYLILLRLLNALTTNTFFQPDEFYQSLEPAHYRHYGHGFLTWEWQIGLRSYLHPLIYDLLFYIVDLLDLDYIGVIYLPKVLNSFIAAFGEMALYRLIYRLTKGNEKTARFALLVSVTSAWNWFMITRSFGNSIEVSLTTIALSLWPWKRENIDWWSFRWSLILSFVCCVVRPTNGIIWVILSLNFISKSSWRINLKFLLNIFIVSFICLVINTGIDYWFYQDWTFPLYNFIKFNALTPLSQFYGRNDWHFHLTQSLPLLMLTYLPFFVYGFISQSSSSSQFQVHKVVIIVTVLMFSLISHKEFRFLYPLQPFLILFTSLGLQKFQIHCSSLFKYAISIIILINTVIGIYLTQTHERGVIDVIHYIRDNKEDIQSVGFLMPCHSTPSQSYLHNPELSIWELSCEPPLHLLNSTNLNQDQLSEQLHAYRDESDLFYDNPKSWLLQNLPPPPFSITSHPYHRHSQLRTPGREFTHEWPSHLVFFEALEPMMKEFLQGSLYMECERFANTAAHWDSRREGDLVVWCLPHYY